MYFESGCGCSAAMMEPGCGGPGTVIATYGPFDMGPCSSCTSGCCDAGGLTPPPAEGFVEPRPGE
jgi:hypothetical protein